MSTQKEKNLSKILKTFNNMYLHCAEADDAIIEELDILNAWENKKYFHGINEIPEKTLELQTIRLTFTLVRPKYEKI